MGYFELKKKTNPETDTVEGDAVDINIQPVCGIIFKTEGPLDGVRKWLDKHCTGDWRVSLQDIDETLKKKSIMILFTKPEDKRAFSEAFAK